MTKTPDRRDKSMDRERGQNPNPNPNPNDPQRNRDRKPMEDEEYERGGDRGERGRQGGSDR